MDVAERMNAMLIVIAPILPILIARLHFRYIHIPFLCALCTLRSIYIIALPNTVETVLLEQGVLGCTLHVIDSILYVCWIRVKSRCGRRFDCALIFGIRIVHVYIYVYRRYHQRSVKDRFVSRDLSPPYFFYFPPINLGTKDTILRVKYFDRERERKEIIGIKLVSTPTKL